MLGKFPPLTRTLLTAKQMANLKGIEATIRAKFAEGTVKLTDVICFSVDRAAGKVYKQHLTKNILPTLTTNSKYLMVVDVKGCVNSSPDSERDFMRLVHNSEKLTCQGFPKNVLVSLGSQSLAQKASGNAYPPPLIVANLHPIVKGIVEADGLNFKLPSIAEDLPARALVALARSLFLAQPASVGPPQSVNQVKRPLGERTRRLTRQKRRSSSDSE